MVDFIIFLFDFIIHLDKHLQAILQNYGAFTYLILFAIVFCETGLVVMPILPGDSLIFVAGTFAAIASLQFRFLAFLLIFAAFAGDTVNYHIGKFIGPKIFGQGKIRFLNKEYLMKTHDFYEKYGGKTIIFARFIPIIRTFAPFVAGIGSMEYSKFVVYNLAGGISWVLLFLCGGYFFGNIPTVKHNFTLVIFAIIFISILPAVITFLKEKYFKKQVNL